MLSPRLPRNNYRSGIYSLISFSVFSELGLPVRSAILTIISPYDSEIELKNLKLDDDTHTYSNFLEVSDHTQ